MIGSLLPRHNETARRVFGDNDILPPGVILELDRPEWHWAGRSLLVSEAVLQPLNAAQVSAVQLRNPALSKVIAVIEEIEVAVSNAANAEVQLGVLVNQADLGTIGPGSIARDSRWPSLLQGSCILSRANNVGTANQIRYVLLLAATPYVFKGPIVLAPGATARLATTASNINLYASFHWRERPLEAEEFSDR